MNNHYEKPYCGTLRISNPKTLERWIHNGEYKILLDKGFIFNPDCGRFRTVKCTCHKCRKPNGTIAGNKLRQTLINHKQSTQHNCFI